MVGERLLQIIRQVGIFMLCAQAILHFKPTENYGKYIRLLISIMVLVQLIVPVLEIFGGSGREAFLGRVAFYDEALEVSLEEVNITSVMAEKMLEDMTMEEIKTRINNETEQEKRQGTREEPENEGIQIDRIEVSAGD